MRCSDCGRYQTIECHANPMGADWDLAECLNCFLSKPKRSSKAAMEGEEIDKDEYASSHQVMPLTGLRKRVCPNCGQENTGTSNSACQLCGYSLALTPYKRIPTAQRAREKGELYEDTSSSEPEPMATPIEVTTEELYSDCRVDKVDADGKFRGKTLQVTGVVDRVVVDDDYDIYYVILGRAGAKKEEQWSVNCMFDRINKTDLSGLSTGKMATVRGKYDGFETNISIKDCILVSLPVTEENMPVPMPNEGKLSPTLTLDPEVQRMPDSSPEPGSTAIEVTADELSSTHQEDSYAAYAKFMNKTLSVTGTVYGKVVNDNDDIYHIILTGVEKREELNVRCLFDKRLRLDLNQLAVGQIVTVLGKYSGYIINIIIRDCVLVSCDSPAVT